MFARGRSVQAMKVKSPTRRNISKTRVYCSYACVKSPNLREGGGGQGLSWPISNVLVDTRTHELLVEATNRYQASLNLPPEEWARMVCADGEAWRARTRPNP